MVSDEPWYQWGIWAFRAVYTQANGAGGAIVVDVAPARGQTMIIMHAYGINSGTNALQMLRNDEDDATSTMYLDVASAATTEGAIPQNLAGSGTDGRRIDSTPQETRFFRGDDQFTVQQTGAGAQNDTLTIDLRAFLSGPAIPARSVLRSTNPGDVTEATPLVNVIL